MIDEQPKDLAAFGLGPAAHRGDLQARRRQGHRAPAASATRPRPAATSTRSSPTSRGCSWSRPTSKAPSTRRRSSFATSASSTFDREKVDAIDRRPRRRRRVQLARQGDAWAGEAAVGRARRFRRRRVAAVAALQRPDEVDRRPTDRRGGAARSTGSTRRADATVTLARRQHLGRGILHRQGDAAGRRLRQGRLAPDRLHGREGARRRPARKAPADYRMKDVFAFRAFTGTRLEVTRGGSHRRSSRRRRARRRTRSRSGRWCSRPRPVDDTKIEDLAARSPALRAESFVDAAAGQAPPKPRASRRSSTRTRSRRR